MEKGDNTINADDQTKAIDDAQKKMRESVGKNKSLMINARERAMTLIENYIVQLGQTVGKEYKVLFTDNVDTSNNVQESTKE
ncbi:MAG: hypothetical protein Q4E53_07010 [Eubacteriales bacterium]|nr:hypothetical protein [Eubacteriales bacterium]